MIESQFSVKTEVYEGPLDLLLDLVVKRKVFVGDISLADVTDDFIRYIEEHDEFPLGESAEFIVVASTLMLVKSRELLPQIQLTEEEEESIQDLEDRLALYGRAKELATALKELYGKNIIYPKTPSKHQAVIFSPDAKTDPTHLLEALQELINTLPQKEAVPQTTIKKVVSLEETVEKLAERITLASKLNFRDFHGTKGPLTRENKISVIIGFLAMLELVRRGIIRVSQGADGDIEMERETTYAHIES